MYLILVFGGKSDVNIGSCNILPDPNVPGVDMSQITDWLKQFKPDLNMPDFNLPDLKNLLNAPNINEIRY